MVFLYGHDYRIAYQHLIIFFVFALVPNLKNIKCIPDWMVLVVKWRNHSQPCGNSQAQKGYKSDSEIIAHIRICTSSLSESSSIASQQQVAQGTAETTSTSQSDSKTSNFQELMILAVRYTLYCSLPMSLVLGEISW